MSTIRVKFVSTALGGYTYLDITNVSDYVVQSGDYVYYDVFHESTGNLSCGFDMQGTSGTLRDSGTVDQNGITAHPVADLGTRAANQWYSRKIAVPASLVGQTMTQYFLANGYSTSGNLFSTARFRNIYIGDINGNIRKVIVGETSPTPIFQLVHVSYYGRHHFWVSYEDERKDTVYINNGSAAYTAGGLISMRTILPANMMQYSGGRVRVGFNVQNQCSFGGVSIAETDPNNYLDVVDSTWKALTFSGASILTPTNYGIIYTDWIDFAFDKTKKYSVTFVYATSMSSYAGTPPAGVQNVYQVSNDISYTKDWSAQALTTTDGAVYVIDSIEVDRSIRSAQQIAYNYDFTSIPSPSQATTVNSVVSGVANLTATTVDPFFNMYSLGSFSPSTYKYIEVKYRILNSIVTSMQIFFTNALYTSANGAQYVQGVPLIADGKWHVYTLDMSTHANWMNSNVTGWRFDWATEANVNMELDYIRLVNTPLSVSTDVEPPTCINTEVVNISSTGYDVYAHGVADESPISRVMFPTWTDYNGQDDLAASWSTNAIVQGQTNLYPTPSKFSIYNNFALPYSVTILEERAYNRYVVRSSMTPDAAHVADFQTAFANHGVYSTAQVTFKAYTQYTVSVYWRGVTYANTEVNLCASNIGGWIDGGTVDLGNGWKRTSAYRDGSVTTDKTDLIFFSFRSASATAGVPIVVDWVFPQLEIGTTALQNLDTEIVADELLMEFGDATIGTTAPYGRDQYTRMGHISIIGTDGVDYGLNTNGATWTASSTIAGGTSTTYLGLPVQTVENSQSHHMDNTGYKWYRWKSTSARNLALIRPHTGAMNPNFNADDFPQTVKITYKNAGVIVGAHFYTFPHPTNSPTIGESVDPVPVPGNMYKFHVNKAEHNNEMGPYNTHIYMWDTNGNYASFGNFANIVLVDPITNKSSTDTVLPKIVETKLVSSIMTGTMLDTLKPHIDELSWIAKTSVAGISNDGTQLINGIVAPTYKYLILGDNLLDGSSHPFDGTGEEGFYGSNVSNASGVFATAEKVAVKLTASKTFLGITVVGNSAFNEYPVDFIVNAYLNSTLVDTRTITGNNAVTHTCLFGASRTANEIEVLVTKINKASTSLKLVELNTVIGDLSSDTLTPKLIEVDVVTASDTSIDTLLPHIDETRVTTVTDASSDIMLPHIDESVSSITVYEYSTDILLPHIDEISLVGKQFAAGDVLTPKLIESSLETVTAGSIDSVLPKLADISKVDVSDNSADILTPNITEVSVETISAFSSDILLSHLDELGSVTGNDSSIDIVTLTITEAVGLVTVYINSTDNIKANLTEVDIFTSMLAYATDDINLAWVESGIVTSQTNRTDNIKPALVENDLLNSTDNTTDSILSKLIESSSVEYREIWSTDNIITKLTEAASDIDVTANSVDNILTKITEVSQDIPVNASTDDLLLCKLLEQSEIWAYSEVNDYTHIEQVLDRLPIPTYKTLVLNNNILDGSSHPMDALKNTQTGWWGTTVSDANGNLAVSPKLMYKLKSPVNVRGLLVAGDVLLNEYPVDFTVQLFNAGTLVQTIVVTDNNSASYVKSFGTTYDADRFEITVSKISKAYSVPKLVDFVDLMVVESFDSLPIIINPSDEEDNTTNSYDTLTPKVIETRTATISDDTLETVQITLTETSFLQVLLTSTDTLAPHIDELKDLTVYVSTSTTCNINITEIRTCTATEVTSDSILTKLTEFSYGVQSNGITVDNFNITFTESVSIQVTMNRSEELLSQISEASDIVNSFERVDAGVIDIDFSTSLTDLSGIHFWIKAYDVEKMIIKELVNMTNVHTRMDEDSRQIFGKVEIVYTDPFMDNTITYATNEPNSRIPISSIADNVETPSYKWFSLHKNVLDGTYHPLAIDGSVSTGWWGTSLSDGSGVFSTPPTIAISFAARYFQGLKVVGDSLLGCYPVNFLIKAYNISNVVIHTETVVNNTLVNWTKDLELFEVAKLELIITKISTPNAVAKIMEFYTAVTQEYDLESINELHLLEELNYTSDTIPLGAVSSNELDLVLDNKDFRFSQGNTQSPLQGLLKKNRRVTAWLGVEVLADTIEWHKLGVFWTTNWKVPDKSLSAYVTARDRLELLRQKDYTTSPVFINKDVYYLFTTILQAAGLTSDQYQVDISLQDIILPYAWFDRMTFKDALKELASAVYVEVFCNREDQVIVNNVQDAISTMYVFDDDVNLYNKDFPLAWAEVLNKVNVTVGKWSAKTDQLAYSDEDFTIPAGASATRVYAFTNSPCLTIDTPIISAGADIIVQSTQIYCWGTEIVYHNNGASTQTVTEVTINGTFLEQVGSTIITAQDDALIIEEGEQKVDITHNFIQDMNYAQLLGDQLLTTFKASSQSTSLDSRGNIALALGDRIEVNNQFGSSVNPYTVVRQQIDWDGSLAASVDGRKVR